VQIIVESPPELFIIHDCAGHADNGKIIGQEIAFLEIV
jgi:hypothetical protein